MIICDLDMWSYARPANSLLVPDYPTPAICQSQAMEGGGLSSSWSNQWNRRAAKWGTTLWKCETAHNMWKKHCNISLGHTLISLGRGRVGEAWVVRAVSGQLCKVVMHGGRLFFAPAVVTPGIRPNLICPPRTASASLIHTEAMIRITIRHLCTMGSLFMRLFHKIPVFLLRRLLPYEVWLIWSPPPPAGVSTSLPQMLSSFWLTLSVSDCLMDDEMTQLPIEFR